MQNIRLIIFQTFSSRIKTLFQTIELACRDGRRGQRAVFCLHLHYSAKRTGERERERAKGADIRSKRSQTVPFLSGKFNRKVYPIRSDCPGQLCASVCCAVHAITRRRRGEETGKGITGESVVAQKREETQLPVDPEPQSFFCPIFASGESGNSDRKENLP